MKSKLIKITELLQNKGLFSGYSFRSKVENEKGGDLCVIQMKDLENGYSTIGTDMVKIVGEKINPKYHLQQGDILFISKGSNNYALVYNLNLPVAIAVSAFFVLRPDKKRVVPEYLAWYINQPDVQNYLKGNMAGTYIPNINKGTVENIMVKLPPLEVQQNIAAVSALANREEHILNQLRTKRKRKIETLLMNAIN